MSVSNTICSLAEHPSDQQVSVDCVRNISYDGVVISGDTSPDDIHGRDAASVTVKTEDETIRVVFRDNGSHTSKPVSNFVRKEDGRQYEIDSIQVVEEAE